jgi:hypothetical protein
VELFLQLCDLLSQVPLERFIGNQQYELPILHDLHFQLYALVLVTHDSIPTSILGRRNRVLFSGILLHAGWRVGKPAICTKGRPTEAA